MQTRFSAVLIAAAVSSVVLAACVQTEVTTYARAPSARVDQAYVKPGVDFSRYSQLYAYPMEIYFPEGGSLSATEVEKVRETFHAAFRSAIGTDYPIVEKPAAKALGVRASLIDMHANEVPDGLSPGLALLVNSGQLTFLMEITDSVSGEVLARAADKEKTVTDSEYKQHPEGMQAAANRWAGLFKDFLDENLSRD